MDAFYAWQGKKAGRIILRPHQQIPPFLFETIHQSSHTAYRQLGPAVFSAPVCGTAGEESRWPHGMSGRNGLWNRIAITDKEVRDRFSAANCRIGGWKEGVDPFYGAPVVLTVLADKNWANRVYAGSLVMGNMMLAAHSLGMGSIWVHRAKEEFGTREWQKYDCMTCRFCIFETDSSTCDLETGAVFHMRQPQCETGYHRFCKRCIAKSPIRRLR